MEKTARKNLLKLAREYCRVTGNSLATVSGKFHGNQAFFAEFKAGSRTVTLSKLDEIVQAFHEGWPEGAKWPELEPLVMGPTVVDKIP